MKMNRWASMIQTALLVALSAQHGAGRDAPAPGASAGIAVWDTGKPIAGPLQPAALADQGGWTRVPGNELALSFHGDAIMANGRIMAVFRKGDSAVELCSLGPKGPAPRVRLELLGPAGAPADRLAHAALVENTRTAARLDATYRSKRGSELTARFRIKRGEVSLEVERAAGARSLRVQCSSRFVVLPDFFADDILIDAAALAMSDVEAPSENFLLHLIGEGDAIAMCVFENRKQDVRVSLSGAGGKRVATGSVIDFGQGGKVWVALMTAPQIWHALNVAPEDANKAAPLDWTMPFAAQWRVDFTRTNDLTDSWEMLLPDKESDGYLKPTWMGRGGSSVPADRKRWTTVLGRFEYPCWTDRDGRGHIQPIKHKALTLQGPAVIYPINRVEETPLDAYTAVDVVRSSLGVGPCEYILNVEGQQQVHEGRATCPSRDALQAIYRENRQKEKRQEIEQVLNDALAFVTHIRGRINRYVEFGREIREYLANQKRMRPELSGRLTALEQIAEELDARAEERREKIKTPQYVAEMNLQFRKNLLEYEGPDVMEKLKQYTQALTQIGGNQDELVGECRWIVRTLRQRAGIMMAVDPRCAGIAEEIRSRTQQVLARPATYEGARH